MSPAMSRATGRMRAYASSRSCTRLTRCQARPLARGAASVERARTSGLWRGPAAPPPAPLTGPCPTVWTPLLHRQAIVDLLDALVGFVHRLLRRHLVHDHASHHVRQHITRDDLGGRRRRRAGPANGPPELDGLDDHLAVRIVPVVVVEEIPEERHGLLEGARH